MMASSFFPCRLVVVDVNMTGASTPVGSAVVSLSRRTRESLPSVPRSGNVSSCSRSRDSAGVHPGKIRLMCTALALGHLASERTDVPRAWIPQLGATPHALPGDGGNHLSNGLSLCVAQLPG